MHELSAALIDTDSTLEEHPGHDVVLSAINAGLLQPLNRLHT